MCKNNVKLCSLPDDLQDIVLLFAFNMPKSQVLVSLRVVLDILDMAEENLELALQCFPAEPRI